jgi:hypothetical protein
MSNEKDPLADLETELEIQTPDEITEEEIPLDQAGVDSTTKKAATGARQSVTKSRRGIAKVLKYVEEHKEDYLNVDLPPQYREVLTRDEYYYDLNGCFDIIQRYERGGFHANVATVNDDLIKLHGHLSRLATVVGYFGGISVQADSSHRITRAGAYITAKKARQELQEAVTDLDADNISKNVTSGMEDSARRLATVALVIKNAYYSIQRFAEQLDRIAQRTHRQEYRDGATR